MKVFADTGFWIAFLNPRDFLHATARKLESSDRFTTIITTELVLTEFLNDLGSRGNSLRAAASQFVLDLPVHAGIEILPQSSLSFWAATHLYSERADKAWSLTDCASFLAMQELGIQEALTYDRHFEQMGFRALLREG